MVLDGEYTRERVAIQGAGIGPGLQDDDLRDDAVADLGSPEEIARVFVTFQQYLYQQAA